MVNIPSGFISVISRSRSYNRHISSILGEREYQLYESVSPVFISKLQAGDIVLLHASSLHKSAPDFIVRILSAQPEVYIGIASDIPTIEDLLRFSRLSVKAYFNSYMAAVHYEHMLALLKQGLNWFAPQLQGQMIDFLQHMFLDDVAKLDLGLLTSREKQIGEAVSKGMSNKAIASHFGITERTVKAHLTNIYAKLGVNNRSELMRRLLSSQQT